MIGGAPVLLVARARQIVEEFLAVDAGSLAPDLPALDLPRDFGQGRKECPDRPAVRSDREIDVEKYLLDPHSIGVQKGPLEQGFCYLKADKAFVGVRSVAPFRGLKHIESKLCLGMREGIVRIRYRISESHAKLRVEQRHRDVRGHAVAVVVGRQMG